MFLDRTTPYFASTRNPLPPPPPISEAELIKKRDILDPLEDDDDIDWKHNHFDVGFIDDERAAYVQDYLLRVTSSSDEAPSLSSRIHRCFRYQGASGAC
jgi:hypothetical protein